MNWPIIIIFCVIIELQDFSVFGMNTQDFVGSALESEISKIYGGATVELIGNVRWTRGTFPQKVKSITILSDDSKGNINFSVSGETRIEQNNEVQNEDVSTPYTASYSEGWVSFASWMSTKVATRRVRPGEPLNPQFFVSQKINLATGLPHEYRGVILSEDADLSRLEATQTILEGQFLMSSAVQQMPDIRRGDSIQIRLVSGDLTLSTMGFAEEPGYLARQLRVMTVKSKRELSGLLQEGGVVEVKL